MTGEVTSESDQIIFATAGYDHTIKIWQTHNGICQRTLPHAESQVNMLEINPEGNLLAAASYQHIRMFDLASNSPCPVYNYEGVPKNVTCVGFQAKGNWMFSGGEDGKIRIWDLRSNSCPHQFDAGAPITTAVLHPNQSELFIGDQNGNIHIWDMKTDNAHQQVSPSEQFGLEIPDGENMILDLAIDQEGNQISAVNSKGRCYVWNITKEANDDPADDELFLKPRHKLDAHPRQALKCKFSPDCSLLLTTSADQTARVWQTSDFSLIQVLKHENQRWVWDAAFSADSQYVFTGSSDSTARLWNVKTGAVEREYTGHQKAITSLAFRDVAT